MAFDRSAGWPELLSELDFAMSRIQEENVHYIQDLYDKYIGYSGSELFLTPGELNWQHLKEALEAAERAPFQTGRSGASV